MGINPVVCFWLSSITKGSFGKIRLDKPRHWIDTSIGSNVSCRFCLLLWGLYCQWETTRCLDSSNPEYSMLCDLHFLMQWSPSNVLHQVKLQGDEWISQLCRISRGKWWHLLILLFSFWGMKGMDLNWEECE